ncbi:MAG: hypothetical protein IJY52_08500 [Anaerotignum sp.]|nr:hypothetical protein [Anaerotignum sp.]
MRHFEPYLVSTHTADLNKFVELVELAKGNRSRKKFSENCDINPSTMTRILNKKYTEASRRDVIQSIAEHADPDSGVTLEMLADAAGYTVTRKLPSLDSLLWELKDIKEIIVNSLENEFEMRSIEINRTAHHYAAMKRHELRPAVVFLLNHDEIHQWTFKVIHLRNDVDNDTTDFWESCHAARHKFYSYLAGAHLMSYQAEHEKREHERYSAVVYNKRLFDFFIEKYGNIHFPCYVSLILAIPELHTIVDEFVFPHDTKKDQPPFFKKNKEDLVIDALEKAAELEEIHEDFFSDITSKDFFKQ